MFIDKTFHNPPDAVVKLMIENFDDNYCDAAGWLHDYVCPQCTTLLKFFPTKIQGNENSYVCPNCGISVCGEKYYKAWIYQYRRWYAEHLIYLALCKDNSESIKFLIDYIDYYSKNYNRFQVNGKNYGKGKIMAQSLDEAVFGLHLVRAIFYVKEIIPQNKLKQWYDDLFLPMTEFLKVQAKVFNNISVWIWSCIGSIGLVFNDDNLISEAIDGKYGLKFQLKNGLTEDGFWREGSIHYHYYALNAVTYFCEIYSKYVENDILFRIMRDMYVSPMLLSRNGFSLPSLNDGWYPLNIGVYANQIIRANFIIEDELLQRQVEKISQYVPEKINDVDRALMLQFRMQQKCVSKKPNMQNSSFCQNRIFSLHMQNHIGLINTPVSLMLKSGSIIKSHMHRDFLSIIIPVFSEDLGTPGYGSAINDLWYRNSFSHNTVSVDSKQSGEIQGNYVQDYCRGLRAKAIISADKDNVRGMRRVIPFTDGVEDYIELSGKDNHLYEWTFHSIGSAEYFCDGEKVSSFGDKEVYKLFTDIQRMNCKGMFKAKFILENNRTLFLTIPNINNYEVFTAKTPGNPANHLRNTVLVRAKGKKFSLKVYFNHKNFVFSRKIDIRDRFLLIKSLIFDYRVNCNNLFVTYRSLACKAIKCYEEKGFLFLLKKCKEKIL